MQQASDGTHDCCQTPASVRYLKGSPDLTIIYKKGQFAMHGYTDASFAANPDNRKSTTAYLFLLGGAAISYGTKETAYLSNFMI